MQHDPVLWFCHGWLLQAWHEVAHRNPDIQDIKG